MKNADAVRPIAPDAGTPPPRRPLADFGQIVLLLQGGGALGAYQAGAYAALSEAGHEPDWIVGTSIGAINGALIAGNPPELRVAQLRAFWHRVEDDGPLACARAWPMVGQQAANWLTMIQGNAQFFVPNPAAALDMQARLGPGHAAYYSVDPLRKTLGELIALDEIGTMPTRLTVGAANVATSEMVYFDSASMKLGLEHVIASGALPPAFPAVQIGEDWFWDGGILSNTPLEVLFDNAERRDSLIFEVQLWNPHGPAPKSMWDVISRTKDIEYSSRSQAQIDREKAVQNLRHAIRELADRLPEAARDDPLVQRLAARGCGARLHVVRLMAPMLEHEDYARDIDFSADGIEARWSAGLADMRAVLAAAPWEADMDAGEGVVVHEMHRAATAG